MKTIPSKCVPSALLAAFALFAAPGESAAAEHPFLFFDPAAVATLRARVAAGDPAASWYGSVKSGADAGLAYSGQDEAQRSRFARQMAFVHLMEGGQAYRDQTVAFLQTAGDYDTDWNDFGWVWGGDLLYYAMAYDWIQPALTTNEDDAIRAKLEAACAKTYGIYQVPPSSGTGKYYTNVRLRIAAGLGAVSLALEDYGEAATRLAFVREDLFGPSHTIPFQMSAVVARDGIYKEGSSYQNDSFRAMTPFLLAYHHVTGTSFFEATSTYDDRLGLMYRTNLQLMMPNRGAPTLNTGWMGVCSDHELVAGLLSDGAEQMWYWNEAAGRSSSMPELAIVFYDAALDNARTSPAYTSQILANAAVFRTGWTEDETWLLLNSDNEPSRSTHDQPDQTAIALYAARAYLLIDPGDGRNYPDGEHFFLRYSPVAHNLVIIDGMEGPLLSSGSATPTKVYRYESDPDPVSDPAFLREGFVSDTFDYAESAIDGYEDAPDVSSRRSVFFAGKDYFVVLDELLSPGSHRYDHVLHFGGREGTTELEGTLDVQSDEIRWQTTNEDDQPVELRVVYVHPGVTITEHTGPTNWRSDETLDHDYTKARADGSNVSFLTLLLPRHQTETAREVTTDLTADGAAGARVVRGGQTDWHALATRSGTVSYGELSLEATYGFARVETEVPQLLAVKRGVSLTVAGVEWLAASTAITLALDVSRQDYRGMLVDPGVAYTLTAHLPAGRTVFGVELDGVAQPFEQTGESVTIQLMGGGELWVNMTGATGDAGVPDGGGTGGSGAADATPPTEDSDGCDCRVAGPRPRDVPIALWLLSGAVYLCRRRRRGAPAQ